jgi:hypothetical protein
MECARCGAACEADELREHAGQDLCEDCFLEAASTVKTCDPWAVHLAKSDRGRGPVTLTPLQQQLFDLVKAAGEISIPEACRRLGLDEAALRHEFATLRHLELLRGCKRGDAVHLTLF